jgi:hypothetical protein
MSLAASRSLLLLLLLLLRRASLPFCGLPPWLPPGLLPTPAAAAESVIASGLHPWSLNAPVMVT